MIYRHMTLKENRKFRRFKKRVDHVNIRNFSLLSSIQKVNEEIVNYQKHTPCILIRR